MADQLWVPPTGVALLRMRATRRVMTTPEGERVLVTVDDSGTVTHVEHSDGRVDAIVRPRPLSLALRPMNLEGR